MATRSYISKELDDGKIKLIYCHSDGYLTHNGALLIDHFSDDEKLDELLALGDISFLAPNIHPTKNNHNFDFSKREEGVVVAYARDRGDEGMDARIISMEEVDDFFEESWANYFYIFTKDKEWKFFNCSNKNLRSVSESLAIEYEELGFPRPKGFYGFFTEENAEKHREEHQNKVKQNEGEM